MKRNAHIVASEVQLLWRNKRCHTHFPLHVRCSMAKPSGSENHWIQKPTTKRPQSPTLLLEPSQLSSADVSKVSKNDGWTRGTEPNRSDLSIQTQCSPHLLLLLLPTIPCVPPPSRRCIDPFSPPGGLSDPQTLPCNFIERSLKRWMH